MTARLQRGFTLVEAIVVMVITGIIASIVGLFIVGPVEGYLDTAARADLSDVADTALRRIARDIRLALPNSVRTATGADGNVYLELLLTKTGGRYLSAEDNPAGGFPLRFDSVSCSAPHDDCKFTVVGGLPTGAQQIVSGDQIVVYNLGPGYVPVDAYDCSGQCNRANVNSIDVAGSWIQLDTNPFALQTPSMRSPGNRFQVVTTPVTYACRNGKLTRYWAYSIPTGQPTDAAAAPLSTASNALLATDVATCNFTSNILATRNGAMVELQITMGSAASRSGAITLVHQVHVDNTP